jgi:hypothetical protein
MNRSQYRIHRRLERDLALLEQAVDGFDRAMYWVTFLATVKVIPASAPAASGRWTLPAAAAATGGMRRITLIAFAPLDPAAAVGTSTPPDPGGSTMRVSWVPAPGATGYRLSSAPAMQPPTL